MRTIAADNGYTLFIEYDDDPQNPRTEWDNLCTMVCFHNRYNLGDEDHGYSKNDFNSWPELAGQIVKDHDPVVIRPLYLYDHSGITISTSPFSCGWDSGQVGFIFVGREKAREEMDISRITLKWREKLKGYLEGEVETYDQYLRGDVYGFRIENADGEEEVSCWGFYGDDVRTNGILDHISNEGLKQAIQLEYA